MNGTDGYAHGGVVDPSKLGLRTGEHRCTLSEIHTAYRRAWAVMNTPQARAERAARSGRYAELAHAMERIRIEPARIRRLQARTPMGFPAFMY